VEITVALLEKHRSVIYAHLVEHVGEEAAEAMLAQFPARDLDEPVTKEFVALQIAALRTEMHQMLGATDSKLAELRTEMHQMLGATDSKVLGLRTEMHQELGSLRAALHTQTERLLNRVQIVAALSVAVLSVVNVLIG
jgi:hypothetical protein